MLTAIRENLEFIADRKVLKSGVDARDYQYSLIRVSNIPYASPLANNFNFPHLKIRITMMDKKPSSELHLVKYLVLVPFLAVISLALNSYDNQPAPPDNYGANLSDSVSAKHQVILFNGQAPDGKALSDTLSAPPSAHLTIKGSADSMRHVFSNKLAKGKTINSFFSNIAGNDLNNYNRITVSKEGIQFFKSSLNTETKIMLENNKTLILIDGKESDYETMQRLTEGEINTRTIISGNAAAKEYGKKGEYGVIKITTHTAKK